MHPVEKYLGDVKPFLNKVFLALAKDKINVSQYELDHICYRVETLERYEELKKQFLNCGELLSENEINGRAIANFKLNEPIIFEERKIFGIELPAPKPRVFFKEAYEHVEFAVGIDLDEFLKVYPQINWDITGMSKKVNPDIFVKYDDLVVKFHQHSIEYVVRYLE